MATLAEIQRAFKNAVVGERRAWTPAELRLRDQPPVPFVDRVRIYQYAYAARIADSLAEDFTGVVAWLGLKAFQARVRPFLRAYPSREGMIAPISADFPAYLREHPSLGDPGFLPELARFEWECVQASAIDDGNSADTRSLGELGSADPAAIRLSVAPSFRLFTSDWPVDRYLEKVTKPTPKKVYLAITQCEQGAHWLRLRRRQFQILATIASGASLLEVLNAMGQARVSPAQTQAWFQAWSARGIIRGFTSRPF